MALFDRLVLLATGLVAIYLLWRFWGRYSTRKGLYDRYYMLGFAVLLVAGRLLIFLGYGILASPLVLTASSLIPLNISMGLAEQYFPAWKKAFKWFALIGFLAIAVTSLGGLVSLKKTAVPLFHGVAGAVRAHHPGVLAPVDDAGVRLRVCQGYFAEVTLCRYVPGTL